MPLTQEQIDASNKLLQQGNALGTVASQQSGVAFTPTIPLSTMSSTETPATPSTPPPETPAPASSVDTTVPEPKLGEAETGLSSLIQDITDTRKSLEGQTAYQSEQEKAQGIAGLEQAQTDIANQILMLQAEDKNLESTMQKDVEGRGVTKGGLEPLTMAKRRELGIQANILGAQLAASQNNLALADRRIKRAIQDKFGPDEEKLKSQLANLETLSKDPRLTLEEQKRAAEQSAQIRKEQADNAAKKETQERIWTVQTSAAANTTNFKPTAQYPTSALALKAISEATTEYEALRIAQETGLLTKVDKATGDIAEFQQFFPGVDVGTAEGRQKYLDWKAANAAAGREPDDNPTNIIPLTTTDRQALLASGLTQAEITSIEQDINSSGLDAVLAGINNDAQKQAIQKVYGGGNQQFITQEFFNTQFANSTVDQMLSALGKKREDYAKFWSSASTEEANIKSDFDAYLRGLMPIVEQYRKAGYTDKEIMALMK